MKRRSKVCEMGKYYVILKGGREQSVTVDNPKEAVQKVRKLLPKYEIVGYYEAGKKPAD